MKFDGKMRKKISIKRRERGQVNIKDSKDPLVFKKISSADGWDRRLTEDSLFLFVSVFIFFEGEPKHLIPR